MIFNNNNNNNNNNNLIIIKIIMIMMLTLIFYIEKIGVVAQCPEPRACVKKKIDY